MARLVKIFYFTSHLCRFFELTKFARFYYDLLNYIKFVEFEKAKFSSSLSIPIYTYGCIKNVT